jgi:hypothetical protein
MLFMTIMKAKAGSTHEDQKKILELWAKWAPPKGLELKSFYFAPDGRGFILAEADSVEAIIESQAPWSGVLIDYDVTPVVPVDKAVELLQKGIAIREGKS